MTQAHGGLKSLKCNKKPINTSLKVKVSTSCHFPFQSGKKTLASTLEISTICMPRYKEESLGERSWVFEKRIGITWVASMRTTWDVHKPHAGESHAMCMLETT